VNQKTKEITIYASKILIPIIIVVGLFLGGVSAGIISFDPPKIIKYGEVTATLKIDFDDDIFYLKVINLDNASVFEFLLKAEKEGDIKIETTYWESMGSYTVDSISYKGVKYEGGPTSYWAFYINNKLGEKGSDQIYVQDNDIIVWKIESF
jgi:hypothetical protein